MESRTQGSRPSPRTQKKSYDKVKDSFSENRHSIGQGQECSRPRPRTQTQVFSKKRFSKHFFQAISTKNCLEKNFQPIYKISTIQKLVLSSSRGLANFQGPEASRPRPRTSKCVLEVVLEAKDVLEYSTSGKYNAIKTSVLENWVGIHNCFSCWSQFALVAKFQAQLVV